MPLPGISDGRPIPGIVRIVTAAFLASGVLAGCSSQSGDQHVYCVDQNGNVVNPDRCDRDDSGGNALLYYYWLSNRQYNYGSRVPSNWASNRISPRDPVARANAGLPRTGRVGGTTVRGGGFGRGSTGSHGGTGGHGSSGGHAGSAGGHGGGG